MTTECTKKIIGIDVSKHWIDIAVEDEVFRCERKTKPIVSLMRDKMGKNQRILCVMESTGGYERLVASAFMDCGADVHIAHPNKVVAFARARGVMAKTDKIDAVILKDYGAFCNDNDIRRPPSEEAYRLRDLSARLSQLKSLCHQEKCRLKSCCDAAVKTSVQALIDCIKEQIEQVMEQLSTMIESSAQSAQRAKLMQSMKGVGKTIAYTLIAELPELGDLDKKQIAALVGVAPITRQSGMKSARSRTRNGRAHARNMLYMAALVAARHNPVLKAFYQKLCQAGKPKKVALTALMRKIIVTLNAMIKNNTTWTKNYEF